MRRNILSLIAAVAAMAAHSSLVSAATTALHVTARNPQGAAMADVTVVAVNFTMNGPSTYTIIARTLADGTTTISLQNGIGYNLYLSSQGFSPTIQDQFNNPDPSVSRYFWPNGTNLSSTFTFSGTLDDVGRIELEFINATPNKVLFGGVNNNSLQMPGPAGIVVVDGAGAGTLSVDNVPYASSNTYNIGLYDPEKNKGVGKSVMNSLYAGYPVISYTGVLNRVDFDQAFIPTRAENTASQSGGSNVSVQGVVRSTESNWVPVSRTGISFRSCVDNPWSQVDENGSFQLYGLTPGVTYYTEAYGGCTWTQQGPGDCYEPYRSPALDFTPGQPMPDLCLGTAPTGINDFVYYSSVSLQTVHIKLNRVPKSTGEIKVYVKSTSGYPIPNANVNLNPDGSGWSRNGCSGTQDWNTVFSSQGFSNANVNVSATGYALLDGLPSGNYMLQVWTPFSQTSGENGPPSFNGGDDGTFNTQDFQAAHCGTDDYRININTNTTPSLHVYNANGVDLQLSSITVTVQTGSNTSGVVRGSMKFPSLADLTANPIMITLQPSCAPNSQGPCGQGNFAVINSSGSDQYNYSVNVASGAVYYMNVASKGWGQIKNGGGNDSIHLEASSSVVKNFNFVPAGTITGTLNKPSGLGVYKPSNNEYVWINADTNNGWVGGNLAKDGTFTLEGAIPGIYRLNLGGDASDSFPYALPNPPPTVTVTAGNTSTVDINLINATYMSVALDTSTVPDATIVKHPEWGETLLGFRAIPLPAGTLFTKNKLTDLLLGDNQDYGIRYSTPTGSAEYGPCGNSWPIAGFCASLIPSPGVYDVYLLRNGNMIGGAGNMYPHFVILNSTKNVILDSAHAKDLVPVRWSTFTNGLATSSGVLVNLTPPTDMHNRGNATLHGVVSADFFFRQVDYDALGGDFEKFMQYLPLVSVYDEAGKLSAAGVVIPTPEYVNEHDADFKAAFGTGGYTAFKAVLDDAEANGGFGFNIMGLAPGTCYTAVMTTPNYPSYQTKVCLGQSGSTTTITVDLDDAVGAGATIEGVVKSTDNVTVIADAVVEITGDGIEKKPVTTDETGAYKFEGLSEGAVKVRVNAAGYALAEAENDLTGTSTFTQDFLLTAAPGSLSGTVYSQKMPFAKVQPGAQIYAYNDTYNGDNPDSPVPLLKTKTGADGTYKLAGLVPGDVYKVFLRMPGMYTVNLSTTAVDGEITGMDFTMMAKPPDIELFARINEDANTYEFTVLNPQKFLSGSAKWSEAPYDPATAQTLDLVQLSDGNLRGSIPLSDLDAGIVYVLHGSATNYAYKTATRELLFGLDYKGNSEQTIDDLILGDDSDDGNGRGSNEASMDQTGDDPSGIVVPAGTMQLDPSNTVIPVISFKNEDTDSSDAAAKVDALGADAFAGKLYTIALSSVVLNDNKGFDLTLAYDKDDSDLNDLGIARYNDSTQQWDTVSALSTINPVKGTVKVKLKSLASVLRVKGTGARPAFASFNGKEYAARPQAVTSVSGTFAVVRPSVSGDYTGTKLKVFNVPNPFNLASKSVTTAHAGAQTTNGTLIHVEVPAANGGPGHVRIYTLSGELVRDLSVTFTGGDHNYVSWDGRNKSGHEVANGVYYGVVQLSGKAPKRKDATFKMAVIK